MSYAPAHERATVYLGGGYEDIAAAEAEVSRGRMPVRPFIVVTQSAINDSSQIISSQQGELQSIQAYARVPAGYTGDAIEAILAQFERCTAGFKARLISTTALSLSGLEENNPNYMGVI